MSTEVTSVNELEDAQLAAVPVVISEATPREPKKRDKDKDKDKIAATPTATTPPPARAAAASEEEAEPTTRSPMMSAEIRALRTAEDKTLKEMIEGFGDHTAYKIKISRKEPETFRDRATGKVINTGGFLEWVEGKAIDEGWVQTQFGGGKYELIFRKRGAKGGWEYGGMVTLQIAGDPNISSLTTTADSLPAGAASSEQPTMAKHAMDMMVKQLEKADERAERGRSSNDPMVEILREQLAQSRDEMTALRAEMRDAAYQSPPQTTEDKVKDTILTKLMDQDSARIQSTRAQYESEIRQLKDAAIENERRIRDSFERDRQDQRNAHERELALVRSSHEVNLQAAKSSFEMSLQAARSSFDTQKEIMKSDNGRLERENIELRSEIKELRARKDKSVVEQMKEIQIIKEAIGVDDDGGDKGFGEKLADAATNPDVLAALGKFFGKEPVPPPPPPPPMVQARPRVVKDADGQRFLQYPDGTRKGPLKPKAKPGSSPEDGPAIPQIDPESIKLVVGYLERAFNGNQDPEIVAQSIRPNVPDPVMMAIRDVGGVDAFLTKVANLPGSSPLSATQLGRNWVRKVGKALVGE